MQAIRKLKNNKIFKVDSIVESTITKEWMGSPVDVKAHLIVKKMEKNSVLCEEYREADGKAYKIRFIDITTIIIMDFIL